MCKEGAQKNHWLTREQFLAFKRLELAELEIQDIPDSVENLVDRFASQLGDEARIGNETPWTLDARFQIRSSSGLAQIEGDLSEVLCWLRERAPSKQVIDRMTTEKRELESMVSQSAAQCQPARL